MLKSVVSYQSYLFYFGATFLFAAKGKDKKNRCRGRAYSESKLQRIPRVCDKGEYVLET